MGWITNQFSWQKTSDKYGSYLIEMIMMDSGNKTNLFENPKVIRDRPKTEIPVNFLTKSGQKIVGDISVSIQTIFYTDMISNVMSLNEITKDTE